MPSWELFDQQPAEYRDSVLPPDVEASVSVEQASTFGWERYVGTRGTVIGMDTFGTSAPLKELHTKFGFTPDAVAQAARDCMNHPVADRPTAPACPAPLDTPGAPHRFVGRHA